MTGNTPSDEFEAWYQAGYEAGVDAQLGLEQASGRVVLDREQADALALIVKRAANLLYNLSQRQLTGTELVQMSDCVEPLDAVIRALGANPYSVAFDLDHPGRNQP